MVAVIPLIIAAIVLALTYYGVSLLKEQIELRAFYAMEVTTSIDVTPSTEVEMFSPLTIKGNIVAEVGPVGVPGIVTIPVTLDLIKGDLLVEFPGTYTSSRISLTPFLGSGQTTIPIVLPAGARNMNVHFIDCVFRHPIVGLLPPYSTVKQIPITIKKPSGSIEIEYTPKEPKAGDKVTITGKITLDHFTLKDIEAYARDSRVFIYLDGHEIDKAPIDIETQTFISTFTAPEAGAYLLSFEVKPVETYAYIGVWASLSLTYTSREELTIGPTTIKIMSISPSTIYEGDGVSVSVKAPPNKTLILYFDDASYDKKVSNGEGNATLVIPSKLIKAGIHTIRVEIEGIKEAVTSETINVLAKLEVAEPKVNVMFTLSDRSLIGGGEFITYVDAIESTPEGDKYIPFEFHSEVGELTSKDYSCLKGRLANHYIFPRGKYPKNTYVSIYEIVTVKNKIHRKVGEVKLG